uniref:NADH-ubiquinone oxidoreductase chain 2 n=1 Tax=Incoltorrida madagassica TaxID=442089 RepID=A0A343A3K8_9COLE|nr:NADH dehydrogenase subunit 2 [Incoltorrida madagassica]AOY39136.1 NADH dehydrogenase subunit 2 [Incoltorrida madagassica]
MTLMMGTFISISSYSWLGTWMGLEINLLSFIPLMNDNKFMLTEASMKYFLIQSLSSTIFLFSIIINMLNMHFISDFLQNNFILLIMNSSLLMKMGSAPFHFWFPELMEELNWNNNLILMTWQKIAPMILISYSISNKINLYLFMTTIIMSAIIGSIQGLNQINLQKIMAYSSINHIAWMISALMINLYIWKIYFMIYSFLLMTIIFFFNYFNIYYLKQIYSMMNYNMLMKLAISINLLSLGGLPPFLGFLPKWLIIQMFLNLNNIFIIFILLMTSLITLYFYMRIIISSMILNSVNLNFFYSMNKNYLNNVYLFIYTFICVSSLILTTMFLNL